MALSPAFVHLLLSMVFLSMAVAGCFGSPPEVSIPPLTNGLVAEYQFAGTPAGFGYGTGSLLVDSAGRPLFPTSTGGGTLIVSVVPSTVITPSGLLEPGSEFRYDYVDRAGERTFVGKQLFVPGEGIVGRVADAVQTASGVTRHAWVHGWEFLGPDMLLATDVAGRSHRAGTLDIPMPDLNVSASFSLDVTRDGNVRLQQRLPEGGVLNATWTADCPMPQEFLHHGRTGLVMALRLRACTAGAGGDVGPTVTAIPLAHEVLSKPLDARPSPWFKGDRTGGPDAAAWSALASSAEYAAVCATGCPLYAATRSEATKNVSGPIPLVTSVQHVQQWGFTVWDGSSGHLFVVEFRDAGPAVFDQGRVGLDRPERAYGMSDDAVGPAMARIASRFGPTMVRYELQGQAEGVAFISMAPGEFDQRSGDVQGRGFLAWMGPDGRLSSFVWTEPDL